MEIFLTDGMEPDCKDRRARGFLFETDKVSNLAVFYCTIKQSLHPSPSSGIRTPKEERQIPL